MPAEEAEPSPSQRSQQQPAWKRLSKRFTLANLGNVLTGGSGSSKETQGTDEDDDEEEQDDQVALSRARSPRCIESLSPSLETPPQTLAAASQDKGAATVTRQRSRSLPGSTPSAAPPILLDPPSSSPSSSTPAPAARPDISRTLTTLSTSTLHATLYGPQRLDDVPYSYRVPSPKQAFYDSHMGSSSGWNTVKGRAAAVLSLKVPPSLLPWSDSKPGSAEGGEGAVVDSSEDERHVEDAQTGSERAKRRSSSSSHLFSLDHLGLSLISQVLPSFGFTSHPSAPSTSSSSSSSAPPRDIDLDLIPRIGPRHPRAREFFKHPSLQPDEAGRPRNVVILGGYRGSVLRSAAPPHQMLWIPLKVGASLRRPTLELGLTPEDEERAREKVIPGETLSRIGKLVDMGARLRGKFERKSKAKVHSWGYDWRLGLGRSSQELQKFLLDLYEQSSPDPAHRRGAVVIAHSMGGLVALHTLSQLTQPQAISTLTFASTPFLGTPNILGPLAWGDATLWNDTICSPEASFSWRSTFYLLPRDGRCFEVAATRAKRRQSRSSGAKGEGAGGKGQSGEKDGEEEVETYDVDFLDEEVWQWAAFSPVVKGTKRWIEGAKEREAASPSGETQKQTPLAAAAAASAAAASAPSASADPTTAAKDQDSDTHSASVWSYLTRTLAEVRQFDAEILSGFSQERLDRGEYPPLTMLTSGRTPTTRGAIVDYDEMPDQQGEAGGGGEEEMEAATATAAAATAAAVASPPSGRSSSRTKDAWRRSVTSLDYSRMVFGRGDGVITLQSSRSVPGRWGELLVKDDEEEGRDAWITQTSHRHVALLSDVDGVGRAVWVGARARERWEEERRRRRRGEAAGPVGGGA